MAQEPGLTRPLTQEETDAAFLCAPYILGKKALWLDDNGETHREGDLPAEIWNNGNLIWCRHGKLHRQNDLPAVVLADGLRAWFENDEYHRENDLPACIYPDGVQIWYYRGLYHRSNGFPAVTRTNGTMDWYINDEHLGNQDNPPPGAMIPGQLVKSASKK